LRKSADSLKSSAAELKKRFLEFVSADVEDIKLLRDNALKVADSKQLLECLGSVQLVISMAKAIDPSAGNLYLKTLDDLQTGLSQD